MVRVGMDTPLEITMGKLLAAVGTLVVGGGAVLWGVLTFTIGGMRDDVNAIRKMADGLEIADKDNIKRTNDVQIKLGDQIHGLDLRLVEFSGKLDRVTDKLETVSTSLSSVNSSLTSVADRFQKFQEQMNYTQQAAYDPKRAAMFVQYLKESGLDKDKIIIIPFSAIPASANPN